MAADADTNEPKMGRDVWKPKDAALKLNKIHHIIYLLCNNFGIVRNISTNVCTWDVSNIYYHTPRYVKKWKIFHVLFIT